MTTKLEIRTSTVDTDCDVCGRTLLRGENAESFVSGGTPRVVCELCTLRAQHEGWVREGASEPARPRSRRIRSERVRPSWLERVFGSRKREAGGGDEMMMAHESQVEVRRPAPTGEHHQVRAVPASPVLKLQRAMELFNGSAHTRTIAGVARSLGSPNVCVRLRADEQAVVAITIAWELSWYRYEVALSDQGVDVRLESQGNELAELKSEDMQFNATANPQGLLLVSNSGEALA